MKESTFKSGVFLLVFLMLFLLLLKIISTHLCCGHILVVRYNLVFDHCMQ